MAELQFPYQIFFQELEEDPEYKKALMIKAEEAAEFARDFAPVRSGDYLASIYVEEVGDEVVLGASDYKAWWIEHGTREQRDEEAGGVITEGRGTPAFAPLRRGVRAAGMELGQDDS